MIRVPRFEVVRSDAGWFARFVAANGQKVWQTEVYQRAGKARRAIGLVVGYDVKQYRDTWEVPHPAAAYGLLEVRQVDERGKKSTSSAAPPSYTITSGSTWLVGPSAGWREAKP